MDEIEELVRTPPRRRKRKTSGTDVAVREEAVKQYHRLIRNGWFPCAAADEIGSKFKCTGQTVRNWVSNLKKISTTPCGSKRISKGRKYVQSPLYLARCEEVRSVIAKALAQKKPKNPPPPKADEGHRGHPKTSWEEADEQCGAGLDNSSAPEVHGVISSLTY